MADRPGHMLEISDALGRDVDKARAGKLKEPLPVEAFMSDAALEQVARQTAQRGEAVHAESMIPISRAEAAARTTFTRDGSQVPVVPAVRRVIPPPFQRPRIEAGRHGKEWQVTRATGIREEDLIPGVGRVTLAEERTIYARREDVLAGNAWSHPRMAGPGNTLSVSPEEAATGFVAIGLVMLVQGAGGVVRAYRETDDVRVFRKAEEPSPG